MGRRAVGVLVFFGMSALIACSASSSDSRVGAGAGADEDPTQPSETSTDGSSRSSRPDAGLLDASRDGDAEGDGEGDGSGSGGACNVVIQQGFPLDIFTTQTPAPTPLGGAIADGTWVAVSGKLWASSSPEGTQFGTTSADTLEIKGTRAESISTDATSGLQKRMSGTFTTSGTTWTLTPTCRAPTLDDGGVGPVQTVSYTATPTQLTVYLDVFDTGVLERGYASSEDRSDRSQSPHCVSAWRSLVTCPGPNADARSPVRPAWSPRGYTSAVNPFLPRGLVGYFDPSNWIIDSEISAQSPQAARPRSSASDEDLKR